MPPETSGGIFYSSSFLVAVLGIFCNWFKGFASAASFNTTDLLKQLRASKVITDQQVVLSFDLAGGTVADKVEVYDENEGFVWKEGVTGTYNKVPNNGGQYTTSAQTPGHYVILPSVVPPEGKVFDGWYCYGVDGIVPEGYYVAGSKYYIPSGAQYVGVIEFFALMSPAPIEGGGILSTLLGVFASVVEGIVEAMGITLPDGFDIAALLGSLF